MINEKLNKDILDLINENKAEIVNLKGKNLWTNPNPTSISFESQSITLNSNDYDYYEIIYKMSTVNDRKSSSGIIPKGSGTMLIFLMTELSQFCSRTITYSNDTKLLIEDALSSNNSTTNNRCIPLYIVGYKK